MFQKSEKHLKQFFNDIDKLKVDYAIILVIEILSIAVVIAVFVIIIHVTRKNVANANVNPEIRRIPEREQNVVEEQGGQINGLVGQAGEVNQNMRELVDLNKKRWYYW